MNNYNQFRPVAAPSFKPAQAAAASNLSPAEIAADEAVPAKRKSSKASRVSRSGGSSTSPSWGGFGTVIKSVTSIVANAIGAYALPQIGWEYIFSPFLSNFEWAGAPVFLLASIAGPFAVNWLVSRLNSKSAEEQANLIKAEAIKLARNGLLSPQDKANVDMLLNEREKRMIQIRAITAALKKDKDGNWIIEKPTQVTLDRLFDDSNKLQAEAARIIGAEHSDAGVAAEVLEKAMAMATEAQKAELQKLVNDASAIAKMNERERVEREQLLAAAELNRLGRQILPNAAAAAQQQNDLNLRAAQIIENNRIPQNNPQQAPLFAPKPQQFQPQNVFGQQQQPLPSLHQPASILATNAAKQAEQMRLEEEKKQQEQRALLKEKELLQMQIDALRRAAGPFKSPISKEPTAAPIAAPSAFIKPDPYVPTGFKSPSSFKQANAVRDRRRPLPPRRAADAARSPRRAPVGLPGAPVKKVTFQAANRDFLPRGSPPRAGSPRALPSAARPSPKNRAAYDDDDDDDLPTSPTYRPQAKRRREY